MSSGGRKYKSGWCDAGVQWSRVVAGDEAEDETEEVQERLGCISL